MTEFEKQIGHRIMMARKKAMYSLDDLAKRSGVAKATISKIERNIISPSVNTLIKISRGLNINLNYLLSENHFEEVFCLKSGQDLPFSLQNELVNIRSLTKREGPMQVLAQEVLIESQGTNSGEYIPHEGEEFVYVLAGELDFNIEGSSYHLSSGDSIHFRSHLKHEWRNNSLFQTKLLWIYVPQVLL